MVTPVEVPLPYVIGCCVNKGKPGSKEKKVQGESTPRRYRGEFTSVKLSKRKTRREEGMAEPTNSKDSPK